MNELRFSSNYIAAKYRSALNLVASSGDGFSERAARRVIGDTSDDIWCVDDDTSIDDEVVAACLLKVLKLYEGKA